MISSRTKYAQLQESIKKELTSGRFREGDLFYTEKEIMARYKVSGVTVARAMREMTEAGYFERRRKLGTVVRSCLSSPAMKGNVMVRPLLINRAAAEINGISGSDPSWFVVEEVRRGIINSYPGMVKIIDFPEILAEAEKDPRTLSILYLPRIENYAAVPPEKTRNFVKIFLPPATPEPQNCVCPDYMTGVIDAVLHLIQLGHRRIAYIGSDSVKKRYAAFRIAFESCSLSPVPELIVRRPGVVSYDEAAAIMGELLALPEDRRPTAVFCTNDKQAIGVMRAVASRGLKVPEDVSVIGFDDIDEARTAPVPLSTVRMPYFEIGKMAVELLLEKLRSGGALQSRTIPARYIPRASTAAAVKK